MLLFLIAAAIQSAVSARTLPVRVPPPPPPPPVCIPTRYRTGPAVRFQVEVEVRADGATLWSGLLRVGGGYDQTSVRRDQTEPGEANCGRSDGVAPIATSFMLSLRARGQDDGVVVNVRWSRPGEQPCSAGPNTRIVELSATADLAPGGTVTLTGDGGLSVRLRRR